MSTSPLETVFFLPRLTDWVSIKAASRIGGTASSRVDDTALACNFDY